MKRTMSRERGDTLIEVLLAIAILSAVIIISIQMMNRATASAQTANETTITRQHMDGQGEILRYLAYMREAYPNSPEAAQWNNIVQTRSTPANTSNYGLCPGSLPGAKPRFYLRRAETPPYQITVENYSNTPANPIPKPGEGLWIEAQEDAAMTFVDFHIRACWDAPGGGGPKLTQGTVVRLHVAQ